MKTEQAGVDIAALVFYRKLFALDPSLRTMFRTNIAEQSDELMQMLGAAADLMDQPQSLAPVIEALGRCHARYGVDDRNCARVGAALFAMLMLEECFDAAFTPEVRATWTALYEDIATAMQAAAAARKPAATGFDSPPAFQACPASSEPIPV